MVEGSARPNRKREEVRTTIEKSACPDFLPSDPEMIFEGSETPIILKEKTSAHVASVTRHVIPQPSETVSGRRNSPRVPAAPAHELRRPILFAKRGKGSMLKNCP